jgi:alpha-L-fucosidase
MYVQGNSQYNHHVKTYGHPSQFGYKDICRLWRAENWNPEELIRLYAKTGAKYFVALGNHHDNFDCWNSKHQPWNCVNVGPKKDIVGTWGRIARAHGLKFGVTYHGTPGRV